MKDALILTRLCATLIIWLGSFLLIRNLLMSFESFNPSYLLHYFRQELLTPILWLTAGCLMRFRSTSIATKLSKDIK